MKILYVMYRFPYPLDKGDKLRAFNEIKYLSRNNDVFLCSILDEPLSAEGIEAVSPYCKKYFTFEIPKFKFYINLIKIFFSGKPLQNAYVFDNSIKNAIKRIIKDEKIEHAICLMVRPAEYLIDIDIPNTLDYQDVLSVGFKRRSEKLGFPKNVVYANEAKRLANFERFLFGKYRNKLIITDEDRSLIPHDKNAEIEVVGNGIDLDYFKFENNEKSYDLLFVGNMQYEPNVVSMQYLVEKILPIIRLEMPEVKLMIAGADPVEAIRAMDSDYIKITGRLADIREAYRQGKVFIAPMLIGTGLQNKLLEAMAMKIPVVTSELCNKGLRADDGKHLLIGKDPADYAKHCIKLLTEPDFANTMSSNAYKFISKNYSWESINENFETIIKRK